MMHHRLRRSALILIAIALLFASAVACTPDQVLDAAAQHGVSLNPDQAAAVSARLTAPVPPAGTTAAGWAALRKCESSGNYRSVSASGKYRNAYQMDSSFWITYGGNPDLAGRHEQAPPADQDRVAYAGYRSRGSSPWPLCGRYL